MENSSQKENAPKPETALEGQNTEKIEQEVDIRYQFQAEDYVRSLRLDLEADTKRYSQEIKKEMMRISRGDNKQPAEAAIALAQLLGHMSSSNPSIESNLTGDPKLDADFEKQYLKTKDIFMKTCEKVFPGAKADFTELDQIVDQLRSSRDSFAAIEDFSDVEDKLANDPRQLAKELDDLLYFTGSVMQSRGFDAFRDTDPAGTPDFEATRASFAQSSEALYKLQILRSDLQKKMYGRADTAPSEARKIDVLRQEIGAFITTAEEQKDEDPQEWLDMERESAYKEQLAFFRESKDPCEEFGKVINGVIEALSGPGLSPAEIAEFQIADVDSKSASELAGTEIARSVLIVKNPETLKKILNGISGGVGERTGITLGTKIPAKLFQIYKNVPGAERFTKTGLILSDGGSENISHEIRHSLDPLVDERKGQDRVLEEAIAYYQKHIVESKGDWKTFSERVCHRDYYQRYTPTSEREEKTYEQFKENFGRIVEKIKKLKEKGGDVAVQRILMRVVSVEQFLSL